MTGQPPISLLFDRIAKWALASGVAKHDAKSGLWKGTTVAAAGIDPLTIRFNRTSVEIEAVPPFSAAVFLNGGPVALLNPVGGVIFESGISEDALIAHFEAQPGVRR
jgi:hypothetical protein